MLKYLGLLVLLVGHAAFAGPSANLSVQVVPSTLTPPPQAVAAGFTTLALNSDFTTMSPSAVSCTFGTAGSSGWGVSGAPLPDNTTSGGCGNAVYFGTDGGSQALFIHWAPGYDNGCAPNPNLTCNVGVTTAHGNALFPLNAYVEVTARMSGVPIADDVAFWSWWPKGAFGCDGYERDFLEANSSTQDFAIVQWDPACGGITDGTPNFHYNTDISSYHIYGVLASSNSAQNSLSLTGYLDNNSIPNGTFSIPLDAAGVAQNKNWLILDQIPQVYPANFTSDFIVQRVRVWVCKSWQTTNCFPGQ